MVTGQSWWMAVLFGGYFIVVPLASYVNSKSPVLSQSIKETIQTQQQVTTDTDNPLESLRERYAQGELTDAEFERKVENLIETESLNIETDQDTTRTNAETIKNK